MSNQSGAQAGGLWNTSRPVVSSDTQNLLKSKKKITNTFFLSLNKTDLLRFTLNIAMMQESKLTSFQRRTLNESMKSMY